MAWAGIIGSAGEFLKMRRTGGLVAALLVLSVLHAPAAPAAGVVTAVFAGTVTTNTGFSLPCVNDPCPPQVVLTPPPTGKMAPPFTPYGDVGLASFTASTCTDPGTCSLVLGFSMHGYCGLASGRGSGGLVDSSGAPHQLAFTYTLTGTTLVGRGAATKPSTGEVGDIVLTGTVVPTDPAACLSGTASSFSFIGDLTLVYPKLTP